VIVRAQAFRVEDSEIARRFVAARAGWGSEPPRLKLGWSNWGFGTERLEDSAARLEHNGVGWIELHGNLYGPDLGYRSREVLPVLEAHGLRVSGICGMVTPDQELASNRPHVRQRFLDYLRRQLEFCVAVGGRYILFGAGAVGRPLAYDDAELDRAAGTLRLVADEFTNAGVLAAVEPIRPDETSLVHTCADAVELIDRVDRPGVRHIAADLYHMLAGEGHVGRALLEYGPMLANLHLADTNRRALGSGQLDVDVVIMALYAAGYHEAEGFCTAEPLGAGANPYAMMFGAPDTTALDALVAQTARTWREREDAVLEASDEELLGLAGGVPA
jgi:sugar phosphate isomerase/epimerase